MNDELLDCFLESYMPGAQDYRDKIQYLMAVAETFSEDELEMYIKAVGVKGPFTAEQLREKCPSENFEQIMSRCINKFIIRIYHDGTKAQKYIASTMQEVHGAYLRDEITNKHFIGASINRAISNYVLEAVNVGDAGAKIQMPNHLKKYKIMLDPGQIKRIKLGTDIQDRRRVETTNDVIDLIKHQTAFAVAPCTCRVAGETKEGYHCKTEAQCIFFNEIALHYTSIGQGSEISMQEAINYAIESGKKGLVHMTENVKDKAYVLCSCCGCCCMIMKSIQRGEIHNLMTSKYKPFHNISKCIQCGICARNCQVHAIRLIDKKVHMDADKCIGCGNCATHCPNDALTLILRENQSELESRFDDYNELNQAANSSNTEE